jgi:hypothetical protein
VFYGTSSPSHRYADSSPNLADLTITPVDYYREDTGSTWATFQYGTFGYSIASDGDVNGDGYKDILVGAPLAPWDYQNAYPRPYGFVYLYYGGPTPDNVMDYSIRGESYYTQLPATYTLTSDTYYAYGGRFGNDVALADVNGDSLADMIVGAPTMKGVAGTEIQAGRAYVFYGSSSLTALTYPNVQFNRGIIYAGTATGVVFASNEQYTRFGSTIAKGSINADIYADILIGTPYTDVNSSVDVGSVFMWHGQNFPIGASVISSANANVRVNGTAAYSLFGYAVTVIGDLNSDNFGDFAVGSPNLNITGKAYAGAVYVYYGSTLTDTMPDLTFYGTNANDKLGWVAAGLGAVNDNGTSMGIGVPYYAGGAGANTGGVAVYSSGKGGTLLFSPATRGTPGIYYTFTIKNAGPVNDTVTLSYTSSLGCTANIVEVDGTLRTPAATYTTTILRTGLTTTIRVNITTVPNSAPMGAVDTTIVSGYLTNSDPQIKDNVTLVTRTQASSTNTLSGTASNELEGYSVAYAGDVNGDGYGDILVGSPGYGSSVGKAYLYLGGSVLSTTPISLSVSATLSPPTSSFGLNVSGLGDVNGDGYDDVIVGAPYTNYNVDGTPSYFSSASGLESKVGTAYIYFGKSNIRDTDNSIPDVILTGGATNIYFGFSLSGVGDVNRDGYNDILVGAPGFSSNRGRAYLYYGGKNIRNAPGLVFYNGAPADSTALFGQSVSSAGDVNGDTYADILIGAPGYNSNKGRVYLYLGGPSMDNVSDMAFDGENTGDLFGFSAASAGRVNSDTFDDIIIGAPMNDAAGANAGKTYIYFGASTPDTTPDITLTGTALGDMFGYDVGTTGKFHDVGYDDVFIASPKKTIDSNYAAGTVYIYRINSTSDISCVATLYGEAENDQFGFSMGVGDINDDKYADVFIGAPYSDKIAVNGGTVYVYRSSRIYSAGDISIGADKTLYTTQNTVVRDMSAYYNVTIKNNATSQKIVTLSLDMLASQTTIITDAYNKFHTNDGWYIEFLNSPAGTPITTMGPTVGAGASLTFMAKITPPSNANATTNVTQIKATSAPSSDTVILTTVIRPYQNPYDLNVKTLTGEIGLPNAYVGFSTASGDVNGDGYSDVVVGAPYAESSKGRVYIYYGGQTIDALPSPSVKLIGENLGDYFGWSVATGDINADGYEDIIVGAPAASSGQGRAYVLFGAASLGAEIPASSIATTSGKGMTIYSSVIWPVVPAFFVAFNTIGAFGFNVTACDINGDKYQDVAVSAPNLTGSGLSFVHIFYGGAALPNSTSTFNINLTGEGANQRFGWALASGGDINKADDNAEDLIVSAPYYNSQQGKIYLFYGGPTFSSKSASAADVKFIDDKEIANQFGYSIAVGEITGDAKLDIIVGEPLKDQNLSVGTPVVSNAGRVYVFNNTGAWTGDVYASSIGGGNGFIIDGTHLYANFGISVAVASDTNKDGYNDILVGAPGDYKNGNIPVGKAYLYYCGPGVADNITDRVYVGTYLNDSFGFSVGSAGDVNGDGYGDIIVGAPLYGDGSDNGAVYLYTASPMGSISLSPVKIQAGNVSDPTKNTTASITLRNEGINNTVLNISWHSQYGEIGWNASIYDSAFTFSAFTYYAQIDNHSGYAILSLAPGSQIVLKVNTTVPKDAPLGTTNTVVINATVNGTTVYNTVNVTSIASKSDEVPKGTGGLAGDRLGTSVSTAGDVNGDGYPDILVGAPGYNSNQGRVQLYLGGRTYATTPVTFQVSAASYFGISVSTAYDINGDGYSDIIIGANGTMVGSLRNGTAYIFYGRTTYAAGQTITTPDVILLGQSPDSQFGCSVAGVGDINRDGYDDVAVGAYGYHNYNGAVYVYLGGTSMDAIPDVFLSDAYTTNSPIATPTSTGKVGSWFGYSVAGRAKSNIKDYGSGTESLPDILIGAPGYNPGGKPYQGRVYIYGGMETITQSSEVWKNAGDAVKVDVIEAQTDEQMFGYSVEILDDLYPIPSDGFSEIAVGAPNSSAGNGKVKVFQGMYLSSLWEATGSTSSSLGNDIALVGDIKGDGNTKTIAIGAYATNVPGYTRAGAVYLYYYNQQPSLFGSTPDVTLTPNPLSSNDWFGYAIAGAGGITGSKYDELLVGVPLADADAQNVDTGKYFIYNLSTTPGTNSGAVLITPSQQKVTNSGSTVTYTLLIRNNNQTASKTYNVEISGMRTDWSVKSVTYKYPYMSGASLTSITSTTYQLTSPLAAKASVEINITINAASSTPVGTTDVTTVKAVDKDDASKYDSVSLTTKVVSASFASTVTTYTTTWIGEAANTYTGMVVVNGTDIGGPDGRPDGLVDVIIGAPNYQNGLGIVYIFYGRSDWTNPYTAVINSQAMADVTINPSRYGIVAPAYFGASIATGILTVGDNITDLVVGAPGNSSSKGAVFIFSGANISTYKNQVMPEYPNKPYSTLKTGATIDHLFGVTGLAANDQFGSSVAVGDTDGDGLDDVIVGAPYRIGYTTSPGGGRVYIFRGIDLTWTPSLYYVIGGMGTNDHFGWSVGAADINGNMTTPFTGTATASSTNGTQTADKAINLNTVIDVATDGWVAATNSGNEWWKLNLGQARIISKIDIYNAANKVGTDVYNWTYSLTISTSMDDTTYTPLYSAKYMNKNAWNEYRVTPTKARYIKIHDFNFTESTANPSFGVGCLGEVRINYLTTQEFIVGAPDTDITGIGADVGAVFIYANYSYSTGDGTPTESRKLGWGQYMMSITGEAAGDRFGYSVSGVGAIGPGCSNGTLIGAPYKKISNLSEVGRAYLVYSGLIFNPTVGGDPVNYSISINLSNKIVMDGPASGSRFGWNVSQVGDIDGDIYADWMVGAPYTNYTGMTNAGAAYLYLGGTNIASSRAPAKAWYGSATNDLLGWNVGGGGDDAANNSQKGTQSLSIDTLLIGAPGSESYKGKVIMASKHTNTVTGGGQAVAVDINPTMIGTSYQDTSNTNLNPSDSDYYNSKLYYRKSGPQGTTLDYALTIKNLGNSSDIIGIKCEVSPNNGGVWYNTESSSSYINFTYADYSKTPIVRYATYPFDKDPTGNKYDLTSLDYKHIYIAAQNSADIYVRVTIPSGATYSSAEGELIKLKIESMNKTYFGTNNPTTIVVDTLSKDIGIGQGRRYATWKNIELRTIITKSVAFEVMEDPSNTDATRTITPGSTGTIGVLVKNIGTLTESPEIVWVPADEIESVSIKRDIGSGAWIPAVPTINISSGDTAVLKVNVTIKASVASSITMTNLTLKVMSTGYSSQSIKIPISIARRVIEFATLSQEFVRIPGEPRAEIGEVVSVKIRRTNITTDDEWKRIEVYATTSRPTSEGWVVKLTQPTAPYNELPDNYWYNSSSKNVEYKPNENKRPDTNMTSPTDPSYFEFYVWITVPTAQSGTACTTTLYAYPIKAGDYPSTRSEITIKVTVSSNYLLNLYYSGNQKFINMTTGPDNTNHITLNLKNEGNQLAIGRLGSIYTTGEGGSNPDSSWTFTFMDSSYNEIPTSTVDPRYRDTATNISVGNFIPIIVRMKVPAGEPVGTYYTNLTVSPTVHSPAETRFLIIANVLPTPKAGVWNISGDEPPSFKKSYKDKNDTTFTNSDFGDYVWAGSEDSGFGNTAKNTITYPINITNNGNMGAGTGEGINEGTNDTGKQILINMTHIGTINGTTESANTAWDSAYTVYWDKDKDSVIGGGDEDITNKIMMGKSGYNGGWWINLGQGKQVNLLVKVTIPDGYSSTNLNDMLKINVSAVDSAKYAYINDPRSLSEAEYAYYIPYGNNSDPTDAPNIEPNPVKIITGVGPDFKITPSDIKVNVRSAIKGQTIKLTITAKNTGSKGDVTVNVYDNNVLIHRVSKSIEGGKSENIWYNYTVQSASSHTIKVELATPSGTEGSGEQANNVAEIPLEIVSMPVDTATSFDPSYLAIVFAGMFAAGLGSMGRRKGKEEKR